MVLKKGSRQVYNYVLIHVMKKMIATIFASIGFAIGLSFLSLIFPKVDISSHLI